MVKFCIRILIIQALLSGIVGCEDPYRHYYSSPVSVYARFTVKAAADNTLTLNAELRSGSGDTAAYFMLRDRDLLLVSKNEPAGRFLNVNENLFGNSRAAADTATVLDPFGLGELIRYVGTFKNWDPADTFYFAFVTENANVVAHSSVALPEAVEVLAPGHDDRVSRAAGELTLQWTTVEQSDGVEIEYQSSVCNDSGTFKNVADSGQFQFTLKPDDPLKDCRYTVTLSRMRYGELSDFFGQGGEIYAARQSKVSFTSVP